jgi:hypothetical protein
MTRTFLIRSSPISSASKASSPMGLRLYQLTMGINATYPLGMPMSTLESHPKPPFSHRIRYLFRQPSLPSGLMKWMIRCPESPTTYSRRSSLTCPTNRSASASACARPGATSSPTFTLNYMACIKCPSARLFKLSRMTYYLIMTSWAT